MEQHVENSDRKESRANMESYNEESLTNSSGNVIYEDKDIFEPESINYIENEKIKTPEPSSSVQNIETETRLSEFVHTNDEPSENTLENKSDVISHSQICTIITKAEIADHEINSEANSNIKVKVEVNHENKDLNENLLKLPSDNGIVESRKSVPITVFSSKIVTSNEGVEDEKTSLENKEDNEVEVNITNVHNSKLFDDEYVSKIDLTDSIEKFTAEDVINIVPLTARSDENKIYENQKSEQNLGIQGHTENSKLTDSQVTNNKEEFNVEVPKEFNIQSKSEDFTKTVPLAVYSSEIKTSNEHNKDALQTSVPNGDSQENSKTFVETNSPTAVNDKIEVTKVDGTNDSNVKPKVEDAVKTDLQKKVVNDNIKAETKNKQVTSEHEGVFGKCRKFFDPCLKFFERKPYEYTRKRKARLNKNKGKKVKNSKKDAKGATKTSEQLYKEKYPVDPIHEEEREWFTRKYHKEIMGKSYEKSDDDDKEIENVLKKLNKTGFFSGNSDPPERKFYKQVSLTGEAIPLKWKENLDVDHLCACHLSICTCKGRLAATVKELITNPDKEDEDGQDDGENKDSANKKEKLKRPISTAEKVGARLEDALKYEQELYSKSPMEATKGPEYCLSGCLQLYNVPARFYSRKAKRFMEVEEARKEKERLEKERLEKERKLKEEKMRAEEIEKNKTAAVRKKKKIKPITRIETSGIDQDDRVLNPDGTLGTVSSQTYYGNGGRFNFGDKYKVKYGNSSRFLLPDIEGMKLKISSFQINEDVQLPFCAYSQIYKLPKFTD